MDAVTHVPTPTNETVLDYAPGSPERASLEVALVELAATRHELPHTIGGARVTGKGERIEVRQPHAHRKVLGVTRGATKADAGAAVEAAMAAAPAWRDLVLRRPRGHPAQGRRPARRARGAPGSTPRRCSARARPPTRPRSTPPAS